MITETLKTWVQTIKSVLISWRALIIFLLLYAALLVTFYIFIATREATVWQVLITYSFLILLPAEFFVLQAAIIERARTDGFRWGQIVRNAIKFAVITIPVILIGWAIWALLTKWQGHFPAPKPTLALSPKTPQTQPLHWPTLWFTTLRYLIFGIVLPLLTVHLWIALAGEDLKSLRAHGFKSAGQRLGRAFGRALAPDEVLVYALGLIFFGALPYYILRLTISAKGTKTDFSVFILQLLVAFVCTLIGWVVTLSTLTKIFNAAPAQTVAAPQPQTNAEAPA